MRRTLRDHGLNTVCEEARCPNLNRCFAEGTATFMLLGDICTRTCRFCNVTTGRPRPVDPAEPARISEAVARLELRHVVLTSVNRDDLPFEDQGALQFARAIRALRERVPGLTIEVLTPDFKGSRAAIETVLAAGPDVYNHNLETVPRLYSRVRPGARFERSLELLAHVRREAPGLWTKSGLMLGLGESHAEVLEVLGALREQEVSCLTLGQYLRPTLRHLEVERYLEPAEFDLLAAQARALGFAYVAAGPLVRSSFHAEDALTLMGRRRGARGDSAGEAPALASSAEKVDVAV